MNPYSWRHKRVQGKSFGISAPHSHSVVYKVSEEGAEERCWNAATGTVQADMLGHRFRISLQSMMERGTAAWTLFQQTEATFGSDSTVIVSITDPELFTPEKLYAVREALQAIESLPFVSNTSSLFSVRNILQRFIAANIDPALRIAITGESILSNKAMDIMSRRQLISLLLLGSAIFVVISVLFVNIKAGFVALLPNLFPVI